MKIYLVGIPLGNTLGCQFLLWMLVDWMINMKEVHTELAWNHGRRRK
jgi:hypothetical protein